MTLQPGVTPFLAAQGEVYTLGHPLSLCFHIPGGQSNGAQYIPGGDSPALWTLGCCGSVLPAHGQSSHKGLQLPLQKSPQLCSELPVGTGGSDTQTPPCILSPSQIRFFSNHETHIKPGPAPKFTQAVVGREEEGSREQSITFVALLRAAVWQMSSTV